MSNFETWWAREGQEFLYALNTTTDDDIKLVAEVAWKNGAYCAEQAEQEPVATIYVSLDGDREFDDWGVDLPAGRNILYATPVRTKDLTDNEIWQILETHSSDMLKAIREAIQADREKNK